MKCRRRGGGEWVIVENTLLPKTHRNSGSSRMMTMMNYKGLKTSRTKEKLWVKHEEIGLCVCICLSRATLAVYFTEKSLSFVLLDSFTCNFRKFNLFAVQRKDAVEGALKTNYVHKPDFWSH